MKANKTQYAPVADRECLRPLSFPVCQIYVAWHHRDKGATKIWQRLTHLTPKDITIKYTIIACISMPRAFECIFWMHHFLLHLFDCIILVHVTSRTSSYSINLEAVCFHSRLFQNLHPSHQKFLQRNSQWKILDKKSILWSKNPTFLKMDWYTVHVCSTWWYAFNHHAPDCK